jgi:NADPH:quinone reductase-like Zn-dependent oxidoreductase
VRDVITRRLARLSKAARDVLTTASVIGREFAAATLEQACGLEATELDAALDTAQLARIVLQSSPPQLERGITGESFPHAGRQRLEELARLVDAGKLRPQVEAALTLDHARETLTRVASRHTRGKIVLEIGE